MGCAELHEVAAQPGAVDARAHPGLDSRASAAGASILSLFLCVGCLCMAPRRYSVQLTARCNAVPCGL